MNELLDTTEMYLKTVFELKEEGIPALRARIVERLDQSGPTVSETVGRLERDGLLVVADNREIHFTPEGCRRAAHVMRRHRLAELLLLEVIGVDLEKIHSEACRWEHALSDEVASRISALLNDPVQDPFGNPIPPEHSCCVERKGVETADLPDFIIASAIDAGLTPLAKVTPGSELWQLARITEGLQLDLAVLTELRELGLIPGAQLRVVEKDKKVSQIEVLPAGAEAATKGEMVEFPKYITQGLFVTPVN